MGARLERTRHPGIYRRGSRFVVVYRAGGKQRKESVRTLVLARQLKARRVAQVADGEFHEQTRIRLHEYAREWVGCYQGRGRRGFREGTRDEYRRLLESYALRFFSERVKLVEITPRLMAQYVGWLCDQDSVRGRKLSDSAVRNAVNPVRSCLATAVTEGLLRHNPAQGLSLPHRPTADEIEDEEVRPLSRDQLALFRAGRAETPAALRAAREHGSTRLRSHRDPLATLALGRLKSSREGPAGDREGPTGTTQDTKRQAECPAVLIARGSAPLLEAVARSQRPAGLLFCPPAHRSTRTTCARGS